MSDVQGEMLQPAVEVQQPQVVQAQVEEKSAYDPAKDGYEELSSGVWVKFKKISTNLQQDLTVRLYAKANIGKDGQIIVDNLNTSQQIELARTISEYNAVLINNGVILLGRPSDYYETVGIKPNWVNKLVRTGMVDSQLYDLADEDDVAVLFLQHHAFQSAEDWALLSTRLLS